jgi:cytochrome d ubiquinol oxidase subunit I
VELEKDIVVHLDPVFLSRLQFVWVVAFHILLPAFTVGLASFIAVLETLHLVTRDQLYLRISQFWLRIFAVSFGLGVVSGIVMPFQFGTNWSRFSDATSNVIGPLLAYEGLTAFFLEAGFLGVLLFGRKLVPPVMHCLAAILVAFGTFVSTLWIIAVNSWMQTPAGYKEVDGRFMPDNWAAVIFNPSFPYRLAHTVTAFYITTAFAVIATACWHLRRNQFVPESRKMMSMGLWLLTILVPAQLLIGDAHGLNTLEHQPVKVAAMEGNWHDEACAPTILFALPNQAAQRNDFEIGIPCVGSLILRHDVNGIVPGIAEVPPDRQPPVVVVFWAFRVMIGVALAMAAIVLAALWLRYKRTLYNTPWFQWLGLAGAPLGFIAVLAGWTVTETGRQPWVVYNKLLTQDAVSPSLTGSNVALSLAVYVPVYLFVFGAGLILLLRQLRTIPAPEAHPRVQPPPGAAQTTVLGLGGNRPLAAGLRDTNSGDLSGQGAL